MKIKFIAQGATAIFSKQMEILVMVALVNRTIKTLKELNRIADHDYRSRRPHQSSRYREQIIYPTKGGNQEKLVREIIDLCTPSAQR